MQGLYRLEILLRELMNTRQKNTADRNVHYTSEEKGLTCCRRSKRDWVRLCASAALEMTVAGNCRESPTITILASGANSWKAI